jgi:integrase
MRAPRRRARGAPPGARKPTGAICRGAPKTDFRFLERGELDQLVAGAENNPEAKAAILCAAQAGLRMGEVRSLKWEDIDFKRATMTV